MNGHQIWSKTRERGIEALLAACAGFTVLITAGIVLILAFETIRLLLDVGLREFLFDPQWTPLFADKHFGILPLLSGTVLVTGVALAVALPAGLLTAVLLSEFASARLHSVVRPLLEVMGGIPTVVYGYFALLLVSPALRVVIPELGTFNALAPGIVLGLMVLPLVTSMSEDAMRAVPSSLREAAYALGSSRLQVAWRVVVPAARPGILAACVLAFSRAVGETMIVAIAGGQFARSGLSLLEPVQTLASYIVQVGLGNLPEGSLEYRTLFAVGGVLFLLSLVLNGWGHRLRRQFEEAQR